MDSSNHRGFSPGAVQCRRSKFGLQSGTEAVPWRSQTEWHSAALQGKDQRNTVIQDVALTYAELAKWEVRLARLQQDQTSSQQMEQAVTARLQEGVDSAVDLNKAKLVTARVRLHWVKPVVPPTFCDAILQR